MGELVVFNPRFAMAVGLAAAVVGCDGVLVPPTPDNLFTATVVANGTPVESAIVDTGGGFDLILSDRIDLGVNVVDTIDILAFSGVTRADLTEPFVYSVEGFETVANQALVGLDICDCNALGFFFLRKTGAVLGVSFLDGRASFLEAAPRGRAVIPFATPPATLPAFDTSFMTVEVAPEGGSRVELTALVDTGSNVTSLRRGLVGETGSLTANRTNVFITRGELGTVRARVLLFDSNAVPDLVIGTDVMRAWSDEWHFEYDARGGRIYASPRGQPDSPVVGDPASTALRRRPFSRMTR